MDDVRLIANIITLCGCLGLARVWYRLRNTFDSPLLRQIFGLNVVLFAALGVTRGVNTIYRYTDPPWWLPWTETLTQVGLSFIVCATLAWFVIKLGGSR